MKSNDWLVATYQPTAFFSLKPASATSSGGKSLLIPTPFAIKMALLDVAIRTRGLKEGKKMFADIRNLEIAMRPPEQVVVNNTFVKIMRPNDSITKGKKEEKELKLAEALAKKEWPMRNTIAFREYVSFHGRMSLAFQGLSAEHLTPLLTHINYFGKRGGFFQLQGPPMTQDSLVGFTVLTTAQNEGFPVQGILQMLDDCGPKMTFAHADIYSGKRISLGKERLIRHVVLPYQLRRSSKGFSYYERFEVN